MGRGLDIAVDGGGSRLRAFLVHDGAIVESLGRDSCVNPNIVGHEACVAEVAAIVHDIAGPLRRPKRELLDGIDRIACGIAGVGEPITRLAVHVGLRSILGNRVTVISDVEALLAAARPEGAVVVLIAGTGTVAMARDEDGALLRAGGHLPEGGDPGGGAWLARLAAERLPYLADLDPRRRGPAIDDLAREGDWAARGLLEDAARALEDLLAELIEGSELGGAPLVIHGGLLANSATLRSALRRRIEARGWLLEPARPRYDPRLGPLIALRPPTESSWPEPTDAPIL